MLSLIITARLLGPEGRGVVAATISWVTLFSSLGSLSIHHVIVYRAAQTEENEWFSNTFGALCFLTLFLTFLGVGIFCLIYWASSGRLFGKIALPVMILGFMRLLPLMWENYASSLLITIDKLRFYNKRLVIAQSINILMICLFVAVFKWGVNGALLASLITHFYIAGAGFVVLWESAGRKLKIDPSEVIFLVKSGFKLHLTSIGGYLRSQTDILMLNYFATKSEVGWYQLAAHLTNMILILPESGVRVFQSRIGKSTPNKIWPEQKKISLQILFLLAAGCIFAYFFAPALIHFIAGKNFIESVHVFIWLMPAVLGRSFSILMGIQWIGRGLFWQISIITIAAALINIVLNFYLIPSYGMMGAVYATLIAFTGLNVTINFIMAIYCEKRYRDEMIHY